MTHGRPRARDEGAVRILGLLRQEARGLDGALRGLPEADFARPTGCPPWTVKELLGHVHLGLGRVPAMLARGHPVLAPGERVVDAAGYFRADARFSPAGNDERVDSAAVHAATFVTGAALVDAVGATTAELLRLVAVAPRGRCVRTRHGDVMALSDFLMTRLIELTVHGLDLAAALDRAPWADGGAVRWSTAFLLDRDEAEVVVAQASVEAKTGWDAATLLGVVTGRRPRAEAHPGADPRADLARLGLDTSRRLSFG